MSGRISIDPASLVAGASRARAVGSELAASGQRVSGLSIPEGTPPGVAGQLHAAGASLERASQSLVAQGSFLTFRARLARVADGPLGALLELLAPPLLSPLDLPTLKLTPLKAPEKHGFDLGGLLKGVARNVLDPGAPTDRLLAMLRGSGGNPPGPDGLWKLHDVSKAFRSGFDDAAMDFAIGLYKLGAVGQQYMNPMSAVLTDKLGLPPGKWRREMTAVAGFAAKHPREFLESAGKDAIAYDAHTTPGRHSYAFGRNLFDVMSLLLPFGEVGKAAQVSKAAEKAAAAAAAAERSAKLAHGAAQSDRLVVARTVESRYPSTGKGWQARMQASIDEMQAMEKAESKAAAARAKHEAEFSEARRRAEAAAERRREAPAEAAKESGQEAGKAGAVVVGNVAAEHAENAADERGHER